MKMGLVKKDGSLTKRTYLLLLIGGNCYVFVLLFGFLLGHLGESLLALSIFLAGLYGVSRIYSLKRQVLELETKKKGRFP